MTYNFLIASLGRFEPRCCSQVDKEFHVQAAQVLDAQYDVGGETYYNRDFIFVGLVSDLPDDPRKAPHDAVCIEDIPVPEQYVGSTELNLILVKSDSDIMDLFNCIVFNLADDTRILNHDLFFAGLDSKGLSPAAVLNLAYERLHNPLILVSANHRLIAYSSAAHFIGGKAAAAVKTGKFSDELMREILESNLYSIYEKNGFVGYDEQFPPGRYCIFPIGAHGFTIAYLIIQNVETLFFNSDFLFMGKLCDLLCEVMSRQASLYSDEGLMHSSLFVDLITRDKQAPPALLERIKFLGWKFTDSMYLFSAELHDNTATELIALFKSAFPGLRYLVYGDELLLLLAIPDEEYASALAELRRILSAAGITGALSGRFSDPLAMRGRYQHLQHINSLAGALEGRDRLLTYEKCAPYFIAEAAHTSLQLPDYIPHGFGELVDYDEQHSAGLIDTLELYLAYGGLPKEAINELCVSKSTAYYRLGKIRELCRADLENGTVRTQLTIAVCAYRLYGRGVVEIV